MPLRDYQQRAIEASWEWFMTEPGNPIIWLPTAGGKSWIAAELARKVVQETGGRVLVVAPSQELIAQNEEKMQMLWPEADCGMVCSGLKRKEFGHAITFGTLGSLVNHVHKLGEISLVIYDECHSVSINDKGDARKLLKYVKMMSGDGMRIVGLTASPYRGNGVWLTDSDDPIFSGICIRITVKELLDLGYLSPLVNPVMPTLINTTGVKETAGDFNLKELNEVTDREEINRNVVEQTIIHGANRNAWICFCVTVEHAEHICEEFRRQGIAAQTVHAGVDPSVRARRIYDFRSGKLKCLVTVLALLTGFDVPKVDLIVWLRSTKSQVLYCQGLGRGCRISPETGKKDCIVLDFSDTVERMGPVDLLTGRPARKSARKGAPFRVCPECGLQNPIAAPECRGCGHRFPEIERIKHGDQASTAQVLSKSGGLEHYSVDMINYSIHSKQGNPPSLRVDYFSDGKRVTSEYLPFGRLEEGWAHKKCMRWWNDMMPRKPFPDSIQAAVSIAAHALGTPEKIMCVRNASNPKYLDIVKRVFGENAHDENKSYSTVSMESW